MTYECTRHLWNTVQNEIADWFAGAQCPICLAQESRDRAIEIAQSGISLRYTDSPWELAEAASNRYADMCLQHRANLSQEEQRQFDRNQVAAMFAAR